MGKEYYRSGNIAGRFLRFLKEHMAVIVYDCETTGLSPIKNHIIQLSARKCFVSGEGLEEIEERVWYINPGYALPEKIVDITGITDEFLLKMPKEAEVIGEITEFFGDMAVAGYNNNKFDDSFMDAMYTRYRQSFHPKESIDIYKVIEDVIPPGETLNYKLSTITKHLDLTDQISRFHDAEGDSMAALLVANCCVPLCRKKCEQASKHPIRPRVVRLSRWENPRNQRQKRIYVETDSATLYFDCIRHTWATKEATDMVSRYDMEHVTAQVMAAAGCRDEKELARWKGRIQISKNR